MGSVQHRASAPLAEEVHPSLRGFHLFLQAPALRGNAKLACESYFLSQWSVELKTRQRWDITKYLSMRGS